jgi:hypothetical protein
MTDQARASGPAVAITGADRNVLSRRCPGTRPRRSQRTSSRDVRRRFPASRASKVPESRPVGNPAVTGLATPPWSIVRSAQIQSVDKVRRGGVTGA